ncbi:hypothetical protein RB195_024054 [Necator americanus]|uniref:Uncharacterized protein n=1 Tax=Necator americanus TaxID=51031 RepID=A0ABR1ELS3_NECAM
MYRSSAESAKDDLHANRWVSDAPFKLNGTNISECTSCVRLSRELDMRNDLTPEQSRRRRAAGGVYKSIEDVVKTRNTRLCTLLFHTTAIPALTLLCFRNLATSQAGRKCGEHHRTLNRKSDARSIPFHASE